MIRVGDRVKFLNDAGGGIVTRISGNEAYVQDDDGFEIPTLLSNLIRDAGSNMYDQTGYVSEGDDEIESDEILEKKTAEKVEKSTEDIAVEITEFAQRLAVTLAFVLETDSAKTDERRVGIYLLNEGDYFLYYAIGLDILKKRKNIGYGLLEPQMMAQVGSYTVQMLYDYTAISVAVLPFNVQSYAAVSAIEIKIDWSELNLMASSSFQPNEYFDKPAVILDLKELNEIRLKKEALLNATKPSVKVDTPSRQPVKEIEEVDLHIDKIVSPEQLSQLTTSQILEIQLDRFTFALESAIKAKTKRIVFIHGVGNGKLRYEIQKTLRRKYPHLDFQDASFAEYGYGATMVILRK
ncbi:MAG: DUF2027 domain-containing protein [Bacteroidales bacterium]|nr:DUF2027 domain-containing protein [Bacteroidales bacterium]